MNPGPNISMSGHAPRITQLWSRFTLRHGTTTHDTLIGNSHLAHARLTITVTRSLYCSNLWQFIRLLNTRTQA